MIIIYRQSTSNNSLNIKINNIIVLAISFTDVLDKCDVNQVRHRQRCFAQFI